MKISSVFPLRPVLGALLVSAAALLPSQSQAQAITVPNFSFENPGTGSFTNGNANGVNPGILDSFSYSGAANTSYGVELGAGKFTTGLVGNQYGYINSNNSPGSLTSDTLATVASGNTYRFTLALGQRADGNNSVLLGQYTLSILLDGTAVASTTVNGNALGAVGTLNDYSVTFANPSNLSTGNLSIQIGFNNLNPGDGTVTSGGPFDNARFAASTVPEPAPVAVVSLAAAAFALLRFGRARRAAASGQCLEKAGCSL